MKAWYSWKVSESDDLKWNTNVRIKMSQGLSAMYNNAQRDGTDIWT